MSFTDDIRIQKAIEAQPYPLLFVTISGAHLYGFPSPDSDYDLRGAHLLPLTDIVGLEHSNNTISSTAWVDELEIDLVSHDVTKFFKMLLKKNGYVLEQLFSPLIVHTIPEHRELKEIAHNCVTRHHSYHYLGFAATQWSLFKREQPGRVKPLLYLYRVLLTGIHLMRTGEVEANLINLNERFRLSFLDELIAQKLEGPERTLIRDINLSFHEREYARLQSELEHATLSSTLPETPQCGDSLNELLVRLRLTAIPEGLGSHIGGKDD